MAAYEILLLNTAIPQIQAAQSGDTYVVPRDIAINATAIISANSATDALRITQTGAGNAILVEDSANPDSTPFVVTATGDVGIGTSSPAQPLDVVSNSSANAISIRGRTADDIGTLNFSTNAGSIIAQIQSRPNGNELRFLVAGARSQTFYTNGSEQMRLDSSGNLGLGVTPSVWNTGYKAFVAGGTNANNQVGGIASGSGITIVSTNYYRSTAPSDLYAGDGFAMKYTQSSGQHIWETAASGTAGNAISFTQAMTLLANGNLGIGETNPAYKLHVSGTGSVSSRTFATDATGDASFFVGNNNGKLAGSLVYGSTKTAYGSIGTDETAFYSNTSTTIMADGGSAVIKFAAGGNNEKARITSGGDLLVGQTSQSATTNGFSVNFGQGATIPAVSVAGASSANTESNYTMYSTSAAAYRFYVGYGGTISATNTTISAISDQRFKENIRDLDIGLDAILALKPRKFDWKAGKGKDKKDDRGFIAQEFEQVFPDLIDQWLDPAPEGEEPYKAVRADLIPVLVKAIQEQQAMINELKAEVAALKGA